MTGSSPAADLLARAAEAAEALAAGAPRALEQLVTAAEALDDALGAAEAQRPGPGRVTLAPASSSAPPLTRDELGDLLVTLAAAGVDADERSRLALRLAAGLRAVGAGLRAGDGTAEPRQDRDRTAH